MVYDPTVTAQVLCGDTAKVLCDLPDGIAHTGICSPPYFLQRTYTKGNPAEIGVEKQIDRYIDNLVAAFEPLKRVLLPEGTLWVNLGDSYATAGGAGWQGKFSERAGRRHTQANVARLMNIGRPEYGAGVKAKDLLGVPWEFARAMRSAGWFIRAEIIWHKPNAKPSSQKDRPTVDHETVFLFAKRRHYYYDIDATRVPCKKDRAAKPRNIRTVWSVPTHGFRGAHFATYPPQLVEPCVLAGCPAGGLVIDPFCGAASTGVAALKHGRRFLGIELHQPNVELSQQRLGILSPPAQASA